MTSCSDAVIHCIYLQLSDDGVVNVFFLLSQEVETDRVESVRAQFGVSHQDLTGGREGWREGWMGWMEGGREGGRDGGREEGGRDGGRGEGGREGGSEGRKR